MLLPGGGGDGKRSDVDEVRRLLEAEFPANVFYKKLDINRSDTFFAKYAAGVADNLAVSQAQASMAQADDQLVSSLYQHNVAKLSLARALGIAQTNYKDYVGGK